MSDEVLDHLWTTYVHRFLAEGGAYGDFLDARERIASFDQWCGARVAVRPLTDIAFAPADVCSRG